MNISPQSWSIIIFAYNEENSIQKVIEESLKVLEKIAPFQNELIIVDDGSTDHTVKIIEDSIRSAKNAKLVVHHKNKGIGKALMTGYKLAKFENICAIPADGQFDVKELLPYSNIAEHTVISFYRVVKTRYSIYRKVLSFGNKIFNRYFLRIYIKDVNWVKIYKKHFFDEINPVLTSSLVESEICAKMVQNNYKIIEIESNYNARQGGLSKGSSPKIMMRALLELFKLFIVIRFNYKKHNKKSSGEF